MSQAWADIGVFGVGVMGSALARNLRSKGHKVVVFDVNTELKDKLVGEHGEEGGLAAAADVPDFVGQLTGPKRILVMVAAGKPVDLVLEALAPHLSAEDVVIDGGNSYPRDTERRAGFAAEKGFGFVGMGVSGGEEGALKGPAMMPGGSNLDAVLPLLESIAAQSEFGPCVGWCGHRGAGHFVKMVHNGIEYAEMQALAEVVDLLRFGMGYTPAQARDLMRTWNDGRLASFLLEITAEIVAVKDPQGDRPLVDSILDVAGQKGTGRWTVVDAVSDGVAVPSLAAAVDARVLSSRKPLRIQLGAASGMDEHPVVEGVTAEDLEQALFATRVLNFAQGFDLIGTVSTARGYETDLKEVARIWTNGCILRAKMLKDFMAAFERGEATEHLLQDGWFMEQTLAALPALRKVVAACVAAGRPVPVMAAGLGYVESLLRGRGTAQVIQAQRDWFGAHTYRRLEDWETPVHSLWATMDQLED